MVRCRAITSFYAINLSIYKSFVCSRGVYTYFVPSNLKVFPCITLIYSPSLEKSSHSGLRHYIHYRSIPLYTISFAISFRETVCIVILKFLSYLLIIFQNGQIKAQYSLLIPSSKTNTPKVRK